MAHACSYLTRVVHAPLQHPEGVSGPVVDLVPQPPTAVQGQMPQARFPLALATHLVRSFVEVVTETQVVADGVLPAIRSRLEEWEVLSVKKT